MKSALPRDQKQYLATGFPISKAGLHFVRKQIETEPNGYWMQSGTSTLYAELGCAPATHIVMSFDPKNTFGKSGWGHTAPSPKGMGGSPVWLLHDGLGNNDPAQTSVVGVLIEYHDSRKAVVATDIGAALRIIETAF
jgi:hypothetical protein